MAYPPPLPPASRTNTTPSFDNHPGDHNTIVGALADIIAELGSNPSGGSSDLTALVGVMMPVGAVTAFAGATVPTNWLLCDGSPVPRATYPTLFTVIGGTYGTGDGVTTFNVPNLTGRFVMAGTSLNTLGGQRDAIIPPHAHAIDHDHPLVATTATEGGHTHTTAVSDGFDINAANELGATNAIYTANSHGLTFISRASAALTSDVGGTPTTTSSDGAHGHTVDVPNFAGSSGPAPGAAASLTDMNLPPYIILRHIIKAA